MAAPLPRWQRVLLAAANAAVGLVVGSSRPPCRSADDGPLPPLLAWNSVRSQFAVTERHGFGAAVVVVYSLERKDGAAAGASALRPAAVPVVQPKEVARLEAPGLAAGVVALAWTPYLLAGLAVATRWVC